MHQIHVIILFLFIVWAGSPAHGQINVDSLKQIIDGTGNTADRAKSAISLAKYYQSKDLNLTKTFADRALVFASDIDTLRIAALDQIARYYFFKSQLDSSLLFFQREHDIANANGLENIKSSLNISIASVYLRLSRYNEAIELLIDNAEYFTGQNDDVSVGKCYVNIAAAHAELGNYSKAISYSKQALEIFNEHNEDAIKLIVLPNLATQYLKFGDTTNAISHFLEAENFALAKDNKRSLALTYNNLGDLYLTQEKYDLAQAYIEKSIASKQAINLLKGIETNYHNLGYVYASQGEHTKALTWYQKALETSDASYKSEIYNKIKDSYKAQGKTALALTYAEKSRSLADSLNAELDRKQFTEISAKYEATKQENEILSLQNKNQQLEIVKNQNRSLLFGAIGLLIAAALLIFFYIKNQKRKQIIAKQNHEFQRREMIEQLKEQELETIDRIVEGQEEERVRIAADLHDSLGSKVATLKLYIDNITDVDEEASLIKARELADLTYSEVRNISHSINSGVLTDKGLIPALRKMTSFISVNNSIDIEIVEIDVTNRLDNATEIQLFRVLQELITNILKHANATKATVQLTGHSDSLNIVIEDDGEGFDSAAVEKGMGLANLENRLNKIGAAYEIDSQIGNGTSVMINIPL